MYFCSYYLFIFYSIVTHEFSFHNAHMYKLEAKYNRL